MLMVAPQGLEIGEDLLWKYDESRYFVFFPLSRKCLGNKLKDPSLLLTQPVTRPPTHNNLLSSLVDSEKLISLTNHAKKVDLLKNNIVF